MSTKLGTISVHGWGGIQILARNMYMGVFEGEKTIHVPKKL